MSRLTRNQEKYWGKGNYKGEKYIIGSDGVTSKQMCLNKLGKLEDLEEEIGCPLEVLVKALKQKYIYTNFEDCIDKANVYMIGSPSLKFDELGKQKFCWDINCYLEDYKKTWWLKEDKSE